MDHLGVDAARCIYGNIKITAMMYIEVVHVGLIFWVVAALPPVSRPSSARVDDAAAAPSAAASAAAGGDPSGDMNRMPIGVAFWLPPTGRTVTLSSSTATTLTDSPLVHRLSREPLPKTSRVVVS